jgi:hypothetical protein
MVGGAAMGYSSGNEGNPSSAGGGGIEIDPFTGIPYYDPMKRSAKSNATGIPGSASGGRALPPRRNLGGGVSSLGEKGHMNNPSD